MCGSEAFCGDLIGTGLALIFFKPFVNFIVWITPVDNIAIQISMLHTVFKTLNTAILMPFSNQLVVLSRKIIKNDGTKEKTSYHLEFAESSFTKENPAMHIIRM